MDSNKKSAGTMPAENGLSGDERPFQTYLVLTNIAKRNNIRSLLLTAAAFGCCGVLVVGQRQYNFDAEVSKNSNANIPHQIRSYVREGKMIILRFDKWHNLVDYLKTNDIFLVGVEIHERAVNIEEFQPLLRKVAFLMGNEGDGILPKHMADCQEFVMISQYGGGTASLNVNVACSIVLHRYDAYVRKFAASEGPLGNR